MVTASPLFATVFSPCRAAESTPFIATIRLFGCKSLGSAEMPCKNFRISETDTEGLSISTACLPTAFLAPPSSLTVIILLLLQFPLRFLQLQQPAKLFLAPPACADAR